MKKLLNRKGFTIVELIVVIAILGLMLAIVIPMLSTADARKNEVREYARSFYSNVQELMIDEKLAKKEYDFPGFYTGAKAKYLLVCAEVNEDKTDYNGVNVYLSIALSKPPAGSTIMFNEPDWLKDTTTDDDKVVLQTPSTVANTYGNYTEFATALRKLLLGNERTGWYYAVVDDKYRVVSAYFIEGDGSKFTEVRGKTITNYTLDGNYAGVWPEELMGKKVFELPD